jgi:hypothetical protein
MNATLVVCALVCGGWSFPELDYQTASPWSIENRSGANPGRGSDMLIPDLGRDDSAGPRENLPPQRQYNPPSSPRQDRRTQSNVRGPGAAPGTATMPLAPTDPAAGLSSQLPSPPTAFPSGPSAAPYETPGGLRSGLSTGLSGQTPRALPMSPTGQRPAYQPFGANPLSGNGLRTPQAPLTGMQNYQKPFSTYQAPSSVSPWMNLYRSGTNNGTVDNYTTLVRPQLEQRSLDQRYGNDINKLQNTTQRQGQMLNQEQMQQGLVNPQNFINYR